MAEGGLAGFRKRVTEIGRENADRMALIDRRSARQAEDAKSGNEKQMKHVSAVAVRLNERNRRIKDAGGWDVEADKDADAVFAFGQMDDDEEADQAAAPPAWAAHPKPSVQFPGRHAKRDDGFDEDDFSSSNWLR